jgi:3-phenylpropionate/cinnamic acid dioxygenase small subunit
VSDAELRAIADDLEIRRLLTRYVWAIDTKDWDALDGVFTPDAEVDYSSSGGVTGPISEAKPWLANMLAAFPMTQHMLTNVDISLDGDRATARSACYNPMGAATRGGALHHFFLGIEYHDELVRSDDGWRIARRVELQRWMHGSLPSELVFPDA